MTKDQSNILKLFLLIFGVVCTVGIWFVPLDLLNNSLLVRFYTKASNVSSLNVKILVSCFGMILVFICHKLSGSQDARNYNGILTTIDSLDGVRAMASLAIVMYHWQPYRFTINPERLFQMPWFQGGGLTILNNLLIYLFQFGDLVLGAFVILSSILLSMQYHSQNLHRKGYWRVFYLKRLIRLLPLFWIVTILAYLIAYVTGKSVTLQGFIGNMVLLGNYYIPWREELSIVNGPIWFVPYIIILYLMFPVLLWFKRVLGSLNFIIIFILFEILYRNTFIWSIPLSRVGEFCLGITIGELIVYDPKTQYKFQGPLQVILAVSLLTSMIYLTNNGLSYGITNTVIEMSVFILLWNFSSFLSKVGVMKKMFSLMAISSYAVYLFHVVIIQLLPVGIKQGKNAGLGLFCTTLIFFIAYFIARFDKMIQNKLRVITR